MRAHVEAFVPCQTFYKAVNMFPNRTAQKFNPDLYHGDNDGQFTWKEFQGRVEKIGCALLALGLDKGQRVAIMAENSPYWTHVDVAVMNCAGVLVTVYPTLSMHETSFIVNDSECRYLFAGSEKILSRILPGLDDMPTLEKIIVLDLHYKAEHPQVINLSQLLKMGESNFTELIDVYTGRWQKVTENDWATILYTSGTTGRSKGVILTHGAFKSRTDGTLRYFAEAGHLFDENDSVLSFLPLSHIFDRTCSQWAAIARGSAICYADSAATMMSDLKKYNPSWFSCVPRLYEKIYAVLQQQLADNPLQKKMFDWAIGVGAQALTYRQDENGFYDMRPESDWRSKMSWSLKIEFLLADKLFAKVRELFGTNFRWAFSASAGISPELLKFYYIIGLPILEGYGSTELCSACAYNPMKAALPGSIGPQANGSLLRVAEDGELEVTGAGMFSGYLNQPEETAAAFTADGWFRTGDLVKVDKFGYYQIVDRKKAIICLSTGKNVAPYKIESLFATSIAVEQVFVIGDERPVIAALIVPNFPFFIAEFEQANISYDKEKLVYGQVAGISMCVEVGEDFIKQPQLIKAVAAAIEEVNALLESYERIKLYEIITRRFTEENGELTPTQKTKKRIILEHYADTIENLYGSSTQSNKLDEQLVNA